MRKRVLLVVFVILSLVLALSGCGTGGSKREYKITFVLGDDRPPVTVEVSETSELYEPEPPSDDYVFAGWFSDEALTRPYLSDKLEGDMTLYARFLKRGERVVTFIYGNGGVDTSIVFSGALTEPMTPARPGYVFTGWKEATAPDGELYSFGSVPTEAHTILVATWREATEGVTLTVHPENGGEVTVLSYSYSAIPDAPEAPVKPGVDFMGWYTTPACNELFDFTKPLTADAHIYAGWDIDVAAIGNMVAEKVLPSTVKIHTTRTKAGVMALSYGSGVIYAENADYYYVLTNWHVVAPYDGYLATSYEIYDAYGTVYTAHRMAMDESYDLAVLRFEKGVKELPAADFAADDPAVGSFLISVGNPDSLSNCVTYGEVTKYAITDVNGVGVKFDVGWHDAPIYNGSSGGAVFNSEGRIIGINFASATDVGTGEFMIGAFIQRSRVAEFLTKYNMVFN